MKTMIVDAHFLCHRAKNTTIALEYEGLKTGVIYGFFNQFFKITEKLEPDRVLFFWDSKERKRREIYPGYKVKDKELSEIEKKEWEIAIQQFKLLRKKFLPEIGLRNNFLQRGYESDDLIAQYVIDHSDEENNVVVTGDDDLLQLLDHCHIYNPAKGEFTYRSDFEWAHRVEPAIWAEVKKIAGCSSDCVPGISGVGEATALKFLRGELKRTTKAYKNIIQGKEVIERNHDLVVLPFQGTKSVKVEESEFDMRQFLRLCREYGMFSFRKDEQKEKIRKLFMKGKTDGSEEENNEEKRHRKKRRARKKVHKES